MRAGTINCESTLPGLIWCDMFVCVYMQGVVTPVDTVVRATTAVTFWSQGHGGF